MDALLPKTVSTPTRAGRYDGRGGAGWFAGTASQNGKEHMLFSWYGEDSDSVMWLHTRPEVDCTRIDLQITIDLPCTWGEVFDQAVDLVTVLKAHEDTRGQRARLIDPRLRPDGWVTIYVGTREGTQRFYRIYVKESGIAGLPYLRFEVEYKDKSGLAGKVYRAIGNNPLTLVTALAGEIGTLPRHKMLDPFHELLSMSPAELMSMERRRADENNTIKWLKRQVAPAVKRLLNDHDHRAAVAGLLADWLLYGSDRMGSDLDE